MDQYIGRLLDNRYEILEVIGTGGMAIVYKARCHRLNRLVAIKILKDEFARDEEFRRRFNHEGEAVAMLSHPNIVQVYDVSSSDNANYIVMELIDGITLKQYMEKKGVLNWKETLHFGIQIAKALEHAHSRSIVHRDIKPHNVMVLKNGSVKVTDFGIARVMSKSNTLTKEALGSVHYISPEQAKGGWVDNRSDLYSLGVVMYEMMTGRPPYDGESPVAVAIQHINGGAPMPSTLNPNLPAGLEQIIMRAMALNPDERYSSATELLKDMDEFRKDPGILFLFPSHGLSGETKILPSASQIHAEASRQNRTTAEKVAGSAAGAAGAAAARAARPANPQPRPRPAEQPAAQPRPADPARTAARPASAAAGTRTAAAGQRTAQSTAAGTRSAAEAPRRTQRRREQPQSKTREEIREEIREEERNRAATIAIITCSAVAVIAIVVFLLALVNGVLLDKGEKLVTVPNLVNEYFEIIEDTVGLAVEIGGYEHSPDIDKNKVIRHEPGFGAKVPQNTAVKVIISLGPEPEEKRMGNHVGQDGEQAKAYLSGQGMVVRIETEVSETMEVGRVVRTEPGVDELLEDGQEVWLYVSSGPMIELEIMPNLIGDTEETARNKLDQFGFKYVEVERQESDKKEGTVIEQSVEAGVEVDVTETIILTVSKAQKNKMPGVIGLDIDRAKEMLDDYGFTKIKVEHEESDKPKDQVIRQSVEKGVETDLKTQIVLTISNGPKPTDPPTEAPTDPPKDVTREVGFSLPEDRTEQYTLNIYQNGKPVIEDTVIQPDQTEYRIKLTGRGIQTYELFINGEFYDKVEVDFG